MDGVRAIRVREDERGYRAEVEQLDEAPGGGAVEVRVEASALNYKDALAVTGRAPVVRRFPLVPGIDLAGVVVASDDPAYRPGDPIAAFGAGLGERFDGGFAERVRVPAEALSPRPPALDSATAMAFGTAGMTALLALDRLGAPDGPLLVTGAGGGVGSWAIRLAARRGWEVVAATSRVGQAARLQALGADSVIDVAELDLGGRALGKERWAAAIDAVGGDVLAAACATTRAGGIVAACGMAGGLAWPATVAPFILRGVTLAGVDSVNLSPEVRRALWARAAEAVRPDDAEGIDVLGLADVPGAAADLLDRRRAGRAIVIPAR